MKVPYYIRLPGIGKAIDMLITIPEGITIFSLNLTKGPEGGVVIGNDFWIDEIGKFNNVSIEEINIIEFIALWYKEHIKAGGNPLENYDDIKGYFYDALRYIKYPNGMDFHSLLERDENGVLNTDYLAFIDILDANGIESAIFYEFICDAYDQFIETGGETSQDEDNYISRIRPIKITKN